jgi:hypothetical protein
MRTLPIGAVAVAFTLALGCGSSPSSASPAELRGDYVTTSPGPIAEIVFLDDTRDEITWTSCAGGKSCMRAGNYALIDDGATLQLTDAVNGELTTLAFQAIDASSTGVTGSSLHVLGDSLSNGSSSLVSDGGGLIGMIQSLISSFTAQGSDGGAPQTFNQSTPDPTEPKADQANTPESPYDCVQGVCMFDNSTMFQADRLRVKAARRP